MTPHLPIRFKPTNDGLTKILGPLEAEIMQIVWLEKRCSVKQVHDQLAQDREIAYTTVMTTMRRLAKKGVLEREREGIADFYSPAIHEVDLVQHVVQEVLDSLLEEHSDKVVDYLVDYLAQSSPERLQSLLERISRRPDVKPDEDAA